MATLPNRAELRLKSTDKVIGYTLSLVRDDDDAAGRGGAVLQGPHPRRADGRTRAPARSAGGARRDGRGDGARDQEPAGRHRGDGRAAAAAGAGQAARCSRSSPTSSTKRRWPTPSSRRCSTSCARCGCSSIARRSPMRCTSAVTMADGKATRGDIAVDVQVPPTLPTIQGDRHQLTQVFANLLINAYEALDGRGAVTLSARLVDDGRRGRAPARRPRSRCRPWSSRSRTPARACRPT